MWFLQCMQPNHPPYCQHEKKLGLWRTVSGIRYLVVHGRWMVGHQLQFKTSQQKLLFTLCFLKGRA